MAGVRGLGLRQHEVQRSDGLDGVVEDVPEVLLRLRHPTAGGHFWEEAFEQAEVVQQADGCSRPGRGEAAGQLVSLALRRRQADASGVAANGLSRLRRDVEVELGGEADGAQHAQRVIYQRPLRDEADNVRFEVGQAAVGVDERDRRSNRERLDGGGERVDGEVALAQVGVDIAAQASDIDDAERALVQHDAGDASFVVEQDEVAIEAVGDHPGDRGRIAWHGQVEVGQRAAQEGIAQRAAD